MDSDQLARDRAVISAMQDMKLRPGQMLLLGPVSVAMLSGEREFRPPLPDKFTFEKEEWNADQD